MMDLLRTTLNRTVGAILIFTVLKPEACKAQFFDSIPEQKKLDFVRYLRDNRQPEDALYLLRNTAGTETDSSFIHQLKLLLILRREKEALQTLSACKDKCSTGSYSCTYTLLRNHALLLSGNGDSLTAPLCLSHPLHREQWKIQLMASLIKRNRPEDFDMVFNEGKCKDPVCSVAEFSLMLRKDETMRVRRKSPFLAGLFSSLLPGSGKLYAGKPRESLYSFMPVIFNAAQAGEGFYKKGLESPHFYFFGALTTLFYTSNIYGSAKAATRKNSETRFILNSNIDHEVYKLIRYY